MLQMIIKSSKLNGVWKIICAVNNDKRNGKLKKSQLQNIEEIA